MIFDSDCQDVRASCFIGLKMLSQLIQSCSVAFCNHLLTWFYSAKFNINLEPGNCPPTQTAAECPSDPDVESYECQADADCTGNLKCCAEFCEFVCMGM